MQPAADTIVKIVPRCFDFGRTETTDQVLRRRSVQTIVVDAIVHNNLSTEEQAVALRNKLFFIHLFDPLQKVTVLLIIMTS